VILERVLRSERGPEGAAQEARPKEGAVLLRLLFVDDDVANTTDVAAAIPASTVIHVAAGRGMLAHDIGKVREWCTLHRLLTTVHGQPAIAIERGSHHSDQRKSVVQEGETQLLLVDAPEVWNEEEDGDLT
jgi:hypothetical protein